ncbi:MAG: hypothetical protein QM650_01860 [Microlunatus sp.]
MKTHAFKPEGPEVGPRGRRRIRGGDEFGGHPRERGLSAEDAGEDRGPHGGGRGGRGPRGERGERAEARGERRSRGERPSPEDLPGRGEGRGGGGRGEGRGRGRGRHGFGRPGGWQNADLPSADDAQSWFEGRLPEDWFSEVNVSTDREEIVVVGTLTGETTDAAQAEGRISRFREETRGARMQIADEAQARYGRKVSWGARSGEVSELFTHLSVPVMTRLRQPERQVLDTLVDAGVARSRSEALSWAVTLVGEHAENWLAELRMAMSEVDKLRAQGPQL